MQEHIRRAHPDYYIPKLPATKESFDLMVNTPLSERPPREQPEQQQNHQQQHPHQNQHSSQQQHQHQHQQQQHASHLHNAHSGGFPETNGIWYGAGIDQGAGYATDMHSYYAEDYNNFVDSGGVVGGNGGGRSSDEFRRGSLMPAANAAAALAQLHSFRPEAGWESEQVTGDDCLSPAILVSDQLLQDLFPDIDSKSNQKPRAHFASIPVDPQMFVDESHPQGSPPSGRPPELMASALARSPSQHRSTLPPIRGNKANRPRKSSVGQNARKSKHERQRSKDQKRLSYDRKAFSEGPQAAALIQGRRWEDLIDAAASATEEDSRDLTPVSNPVLLAYFTATDSYL